ncbi:tRNA (guanosine(46)-N7)-methyltransferase TrmB [Prochlorococcus marinus]|uniref:tRNA (guanine-N(7)-)-methyltransferase n=1 Tax=Prochlorococcus marinus (strain MIT 9211) TaxID=93059 RepID=A9BDK9_PROM4|nr:tRNA (guanosine(46)-N7)-methyltransferase TrmB [Prochlorococcus marinus]ABX08195.1 Predicted SAM-dependent methyltransferase [Prochlorococcus marinus str. MIT 9211]
MRQHVNPLSRFFQVELELPEPNELFLDGSLPIHLDIGSAKGKFLIKFASLEKQWNFLGVDIRNSLVQAAEKERKELGLENLNFLFCNANVSLIKWLRSLKKGQLKRVSIQFPDPWFKKRHQKRRVLNTSLLMALASALGTGSQLFIQSDVLPVINSMIDIIERSECFESINPGPEIWLKNNPFQLSTEREEYAISRELTVYRALFYRTEKDLPKTIGI